MDKKTCSKCGKTKKLDKFHKNQRVCKKCRTGNGKHSPHGNSQQFHKARANAKNSALKRLPAVDKPKALPMDDTGTLYTSVLCKKCGKRFFPTRAQVGGRMLGVRSTGMERNFYCGDACQNSCELNGFKAGVQVDPRSKLYKAPTERQEARACQTNHLKQIQCDEHGHNECEHCGDIIDVELHHTLQVAKHGAAAVNSATHILLCAGCHTAIHSDCNP